MSGLTRGRGRQAEARQRRAEPPATTLLNTPARRLPHALGRQICSEPRKTGKNRGALARHGPRSPELETRSPAFLRIGF
jgi:hypothetical protein